jgi:predicted nucleotidyltransferase/predicted DNA-binding transcriptional regulator AlpA
MTDRSRAEFMGTKETSALLGLRPSNFVRDVAAHPDFPEPVARLAATPVWRREDVDAWRESSRSRVLPRLTSPPLSPDAARWLPEARRRIVRKFRPVRIVLFGSQAQGAARADSDVDLLVILDEVASAKHSTVAIRRLLTDLPISKDVIVATPAAVERYGDLVGTVLRPALREGVTIYERD